MEITRKFKHASSGKLLWSTITGLTIFHILAFWALFEFSWNNLIAAVVVWWVANSWGVGIGYHRMLTHGGFKAPKWLEYFLYFLRHDALCSPAR